MKVFDKDFTRDDANNRNYRVERIDRLLNELKYEITRGMMENEVNEHLGIRFVVPVSRNIPNGIVLCEFRTRPVPAYQASLDDCSGAQLTIVKTRPA